MYISAKGFNSVDIISQKGLILFSSLFGYLIAPFAHDPSSHVRTFVVERKKGD